LQPQARTTRAKVRHGWLRRLNLFHDLETNPRTQYKVHTWAQRFWIINIPAVIYLFLYQPVIWLAWGLLLTTIYSLYANWATDSGAAAASWTVMNTTRGAAKTEKYDI
jgi:hypothetical protein